MLVKIHSYRFESLLVSQIAILFGSLVTPTNVFNMLSPFLFYLNIVAGSLFIGNHKKGSILILLFILLVIGFLIQYIPRSSFNRLWIKIDALPWPVKTVLLSGSMLVIFEFAPLGVAPFIYSQF